MPPSAFTPDEWRTLQLSLMKVFIMFHNFNSSHYPYISDSFRQFIGNALQHADKTGKKQVVLDLLFSSLSDYPELLVELKKDSRAPESVIRESFSIINKNLSRDEAESIKDTFEWLVESKSNIAILISTAYKLASPSSPAVVTSSPSGKTGGKVIPLPLSKRLPIYLLIDSSRHISDSASFLDSGINNRFGNHLRSRPKSSVPLKLGFIAINDVSDLAVPLTEPATFHATSLVGAGACQFGRALLSLHVDLANQLSDSKPLVFIFLAGAPNDTWQKPAKQIQDLAKAGKINVIAIGSGALADLACLKDIGAAQPMVMSGITQSNVDQVFDWLYGIIDVIMSGLESGASGAKSVPNPPACLKLIP